MSSIPETSGSYVTTGTMAADALALGRALAAERGDVRALNGRDGVFVYRSVDGDVVGAFLVDSVVAIGVLALGDGSPIICDVVTAGPRHPHPALHPRIAMTHLREYGSVALRDYVNENALPKSFFDGLTELIPGRLWTRGATRIQSATATKVDSGLYNVSLQICVADDQPDHDQIAPLAISLDRMTQDQVLTLLTQVG